MYEIPRSYLTVPLIGLLGSFRRLQRHINHMKASKTEYKQYEKAYEAEVTHIKDYLHEINEHLNFISSAKSNESSLKAFLSTYLIFEFLLRDNQLSLAQRVIEQSAFDLGNDITLFSYIFDCLKDTDINESILFLKDHSINSETSNSLTRLKLYQVFTHSNQMQTSEVFKELKSIINTTGNWNKETATLFKTLTLSYVLEEDEVVQEDRSSDLKNELQKLVNLTKIPTIQCYIIAALIASKTPECGFNESGDCLSCDPLFSNLLKKLPNNQRNSSHVVCSVIGEACNDENLPYCTPDGLIISEKGINQIKKEDGYHMNGKVYQKGDFMRLFISA